MVGSEQYFTEYQETLDFGGEGDALGDGEKRDTSEPAHIGETIPKVMADINAKARERVPYGRERACGCIPQFIEDLG